MKNKAPTIRDVAAAAGVSIATISKYVNGAQRFSPAVEATIKQIIEQLGYRSNPLAASMITGRTKTIGLSVLDLANPHFTSIVRGINRVATEHGYTVLLVDIEETPSRERPLLEALSRRVDGMIVFSRLPEEELDWMMALNKALIYFGPLSRLEMPSLGGDDLLGARLVTEHLITLGHKRFAYLGFSKSRHDQQRLGTVRACLAARGLALTAHDANAPTALEGERMSGAILAGAWPDAVVCFNDLMALGFMKEAKALGVRLPQDMSVTGFDNILYGQYVSPTLTSVDQQSERIGEAAMHKLLAVMANEPTEAFTEIEPLLVVRASTMQR